MKLRLVDSKPEVPNVKTFIFTPSEPVEWHAGQSIRLEIPRDSYGVDERRFTISSAPNQKNIHITTRASDSEFKQHLFALKLGSAIDAYSIDGTFTWPSDLDDPVFFAAGIGITPFHAMLGQRIYERKPFRATLFYSNHDSGFVFRDTLDNWQSQTHQLAITYLPGQRVTPNFLRDHAAQLQNKTIYVSGPSAMVDDLGAALVNAGHPEQLLKRDWFTGNAV